MIFYIAAGMIVLGTEIVAMIRRMKRVRRAWYVLRTRDRYPDFAKLASEYFGVEERLPPKDL